MSKLVKANSNSNAYMGGVKLTLKSGNKPYKVVKQHNAGTAEFFKYILNSVKGSVLPNDRPGDIKLIYRQGDLDIVSKYGVMYESVSDAKNVGTTEVPLAKITYKFLIPETIVEPGNISGLQLESVSGVVYAKVYFSQLVEIKHNTNIELEWSLNLCNIVKEI